MATETTAVPEPQSLDAGTTYLVFARGEPGEGKQLWREVVKVDARSAEAAIRAAVGRLTEDKRNGTFVAIPARSFKPVTVSEKVERTLVIS